MNKKIKIARELVKLAKSLVAESNDDYAGGMPFDTYNKFMESRVPIVKNAVKSEKFNVEETYYCNDMSYDPCGIVIPTDEVGREITIGGTDDGKWTWTLWYGNGEFKESKIFSGFEEALQDLVKNIPSIEKMMDENR